MPQAIIHIGLKKRIVVEFEWGLAMIEHNLYFKSDAIEETLIKPIRFNFSAFKKVTCESNRTDHLEGERH